MKLHLLCISIFSLLVSTEAGRGVYLYSLEKGISFFGAGDESVLFEWRSGWGSSELGGRTYTDLAGFMSEIEKGRPVEKYDK